MDKQRDLVMELKELLKSTPFPSGLDEKSARDLILKELKTFQFSKKNLDAEAIEFIERFRQIEIRLPSHLIVKAPQATQVPSFLKILDDVLLGNNVYLFGEAGTGKTTIAEAVAETLKRPFITINCNQWTSPLSIVGGQTLEGYQEGGLIDAWKEGKMLILDELPKLDPNTAGLLNDALAKTDKPVGTIIFNGRGEAIKKHMDFCCIATGNTTGKGTSPRYNGNNKQDLSLLDRFSGNFYEIGFNKELEKSLLHTKVFEICDRIRNEIIKSGADEIMTLRTMLQMNKVYHLEMKRETGLLPKVPGGKTLLDSLLSYFSTMNEDKSLLITKKIDFDLFKNSYKDRALFSKELEKWGDLDLKKAA